MSEQDKEIKEKIEFHVEKIKDTDSPTQIESIKALSDMCISSQKTRTSIPKEIKFLKTHYTDLLTYYEGTSKEKNKKVFADFLSYVSISLHENYERHSLKFY